MTVTYRGIYDHPGLGPDRHGQPVAVIAVEIGDAFPGTSAKAPAYTVKFGDGTTATGLWTEQLDGDGACTGCGDRLLPVAKDADGARKHDRVHAVSGLPHCADRGAELRRRDALIPVNDPTRCQDCRGIPGVCRCGDPE